jgi:uncharacterized protein (TIGR01777 family)
MDRIKPNILLVGGTGLLGTRVYDYLYRKGFDISVLTRYPKNPWDIFWNPKIKKIDTNLLSQFTHIINLSGAPIASKRWTTKRKKELEDSRIQTTFFLYENRGYFTSLEHYITASGINCYGFSEMEKSRVEEDAFGEDYISQLVQKWEEAAELFSSFCKVSKLRISPVLDENGGIYGELKKLFKYRIASVIGTGKQWIPWIHRRDFVRLVEFVINEKVIGPINVMSSCATNKQFMVQMSKSMHKKMILPPAPSVLLNIVLGEKSDLLTKGVRVSNKRIINLGFEFNYPDLEYAMEDIVKR